ncbi:MAG TPA: acyl-CoA dehydrogenase family protein [Spongiibacteraceae bacterium]|jgi:alkylation response protein AidB-like acyl-CoA dehydrogenase|nr:acyl-CoA dehydrogenase family protein [Spongiibacteraceae bacterium]HUH38397.1 acyl-CoA dehydrogenase family protein [Spongiibacteraceae bacterium]
MNFEFSEDELLIREQARSFLAEQSTSATVRTVLESDAPYHEALWRQICELGWPATGIAERFGGLELGHLSQCVLAEELGRSLAPVPFSSSVYLVAEALTLAGNDAQQARWLPGLASGEVIGCLASVEGASAPLPRKLATRHAGGKLRGEKAAVVDVTAASLAVVLAADADAGDRPSLFLVELNQAGVSREAVNSLDASRPQGSLRLDAVAAERLGEAGEGEALLSRLLDRAAVLFAFEQVGGAEACLHMALQYTKERYAFGRPVASFQAIKHKLADMFAKIELARGNAYYAAWALSTDAPELPLAAATARVSAIDAYYYASKENIQAHGGMGFTWEFDCHLHYRRAQLLSLQLGGQPWWKARLVQQLLAA